MQIVIVTDDVAAWSFLNEFPVIHADDYLKGCPYQTNALRVINLCQSYEYQTIGYYVSLLAAAQDQKVFPSIQTLQDSHIDIAKQFLQKMDADIQKSLSTQRKNSLTIRIYFGECPQSSFALLARHIYGLFPLPLFTLHLSKQNKIWTVIKMSSLSVHDIPAEEQEFMHSMARAYLNKKRFYAGPNKKQHFFHLAILVDRAEKNPPSNAEALSKFVQAGETLGIHVDLIEKQDFHRLPEYAGLFIRTTTRVNHYTYQFSRYAAQNNMVVIDDPQSILRCTNKVYQAATLINHGIKTPRTIIVNKHQQTPPDLPFPCVIKRPDSELSKDVVKVNNAQEMQAALGNFFQFSDLVIVQEFLPTDFDWRIGMIDSKPLFVSKYYMAKGHWQIINWASAEEYDGEDDCVPIEKVPEGVIQTALRAASLMGNGLYGVDLKTFGNENYIIEVNDNPSIEVGCEDKFLGNYLFQKIMAVFLQRMQAKHGMAMPGHSDELKFEYY